MINLSVQTILFCPVSRIFFLFEVFSQFKNLRKSDYPITKAFVERFNTGISIILMQVS